MNWQPYCGICFLKQVISVGEMLGLEDGLVKSLIRDVALLVSRLPDDITPPAFAIDVYALLRDRLGDKDLFASVKKVSNEKAKQFLKSISNATHLWKDEREKFLFFLKLAISGNIIDYGVAPQSDPLKKIDDLFRLHLPKEKRLFDLDSFITSLENASYILYLLDNCGEVIFDMEFAKLLKEKFPEKRITFVARGMPVINDVTIDDAKEIGIDKIGKLVSTGIAAPGVILDKVDRCVVEEFKKADLIISKGQGNFESLWQEDKSYPIFFLFVVKCKPVANLIGAKEGQILLINSQTQTINFNP